MLRCPNGIIIGKKKASEYTGVCVVYLSTYNHSLPGRPSTTTTYLLLYLEFTSYLLYHLLVAYSIPTYVCMRSGTDEMSGK